MDVVIHCPLCQDMATIRSYDHGEQLEIVCKSCTVYRVSAAALNYLILGFNDRKAEYAALAKASPPGQTSFIRYRRVSGANDIREVNLYSQYVNDAELAQH